MRRSEHRQRAQSGMNAAMLVAIISALIVIYILFLPSEDRLELIGENDTDDDGEDGGDFEKILLEDKQLILEVIEEDEIDHELPSVNLYTSTSADVLREESSIYVKNGIFDKLEKEIDFRVETPENTKNLLMSFFVKRNKGRLLITINNKEILNKNIDEVNVEPVKIPKEYIAENNVLKIAVSGVGAKFWSTNEYLIENFKITGDITDTSTKESTLSFVVPRSESQNIEKAEIRFVPECQEANVGMLEILINSHLIFSSIPDCGVPRPLESTSAAIIT